LGMLMRGHFAAGLKRRQHLIHCFPTRHRLPFDAGTNRNPGIFVFHNLVVLLDLNPKMVG